MLTDRELALVIATLRAAADVAKLRAVIAKLEHELKIRRMLRQTARR